MFLNLREAFPGVCGVRFMNYETLFNWEKAEAGATNREIVLPRVFKCK